MSYPPAGGNGPQQPYAPQQPSPSQQPQPTQWGQPVQGNPPTANQASAPSQPPTGYPPPGQPPYQGQVPPQYQGQFPSPGQPPKRRNGPPAGAKAVILIVCALAVVAVTVVKVAMNHTSAGNSGGNAPKVARPANWPQQLAGLYLDQDAPSFHAARAKYDWVVAKFYGNQPRSQRHAGFVSYSLTAYGPLSDVKDAIITKQQIQSVGNGVCYDGDQPHTRSCAALSGGVVVIIDHVWPGQNPRTPDQKLVSYASTFAATLSKPS